MFGVCAHQSGRQLQTLLFSATLHDQIIQTLSQQIQVRPPDAIHGPHALGTDRGVQKFPTWVDLKGKDAVPETVHHVLLRVDPKADKRWTKQDKRVTTDGKPNAQFRLREVV